jgi:hypothetical protein
MDWNEMNEQLKDDLLTNRKEILGLTGFTEEYKGWNDDIYVEKNADEFINEIVSTLLKAAAIRISGDFKPKGQIIDELNKIFRNPSLVNHRPGAISPEAIGVIECAYEELFNTWLPNEPPAHKVKDAIGYAKRKIKEEDHIWLHANLSQLVLALSLQAFFGRFGKKVARTVTRETGKSIEVSNFTEFLSFVVIPLNDAINSYEVKKFNIRSIAECAAKIAKGKKTPQIQEVMKITSHKTA